VPFTPTPMFARDNTMEPLEWQSRMREWFRFMRDTEPVSYSEATGCWRIYRYDDVARFLNDYTTFSSEVRTDRNIADASIISMDPPRHHQMRSLVTLAFTPRTIAQMAPRITEITQDLLTIPLQKGEMDFISEFTSPLPIKVIAAMLGLPLADWQTLRDWTSSFLVDLGPTPASATLQAMQQRWMQVFSEMHAYFGHMIEERRREPREDLISLLIAAEVDRQRLSDAELFSFCQTLLVAGNVTTTQFLGNVFLCFDQHPDAWQQLLQNRSLVPNAIEEVLRYMPPDKGLAENAPLTVGRTATVDVMLGDQLIRKGDKVNGSALSANWDERQFPDPERFAIERTPNRHLTFGHGIHFCLGAPLARLETKIALEILLEVMPRWSIRPDTQLDLVDSPHFFGVKQLPIVIG